MTNNALEIKNLCKSYDGFKLDDINITLPYGCVLGLVGENGAGKSTLIKLILDITERDGGDITILGKSNKDMLHITKQKVGIVPDEVSLPYFSKVKDIRAIMRLTFNEWDDELFDSYISRFNIPSDKKFKDMSKGTKMKLGIAVALSHRPNLLILDEPTSGFDPISRDLFVNILTDFTRDEKHSVLISSHITCDLERICDYIAFMKNGKLILFEEKDKLLAHHAIAHISEDMLSAIPKEAIIHISNTNYGLEAVVIRELVPSGIELAPISLEEIFVAKAKERAVL